MNTEDTHESNAAKTTGVRLRTAREQLGLTQQAVAERLCLKVSTVRDIEDDKAPAGLASTFLRGYLRSYARLVRIPEEELLPIMEKQVPVRAEKVAPMQSFSLGKSHKKRDGWLMSFTWLVLFVVVGLTGAWWWQNHKVQQQEISTMANQSSAELTAGSRSRAQPVSLNTGSDARPDNSTQPEAAAPAKQAEPVESAGQTAQQNSVQPGTSIDNSAVVSPSQAPVDNAQVPNPTAAATLPTDQAGVMASAADSNALVMNFNADCWLDVTDASGKKLFSGMQKKGANLNLTGLAPYKLKIGAPAAVQIQFQGKPVDLSRFIRTNQVARLTVNAE